MSAGVSYAAKLSGVTALTATSVFVAESITATLISKGFVAVNVGCGSGYNAIIVSNNVRASVSVTQVPPFKIGCM